MNIVQLYALMLPSQASWASGWRKREVDSARTRIKKILSN